ncbi:MAG: hypothetical protein ABI663_18705 [Chryseolinea sp.]
MEQLHDTLQFWKNVGYYGGGALFVLSLIVGAISFYKTSALEKVIRLESKKSDDSSRNEFLDGMKRQELAFNEYKDLLLKEKKASNIEKIKPSQQENVKPPDKEKVLEDNFEYEIDAQNKLVKFWPKTGEWKKPIVAYPSQESAVVKGSLTSKQGLMYMVMEGINNEHKLSFIVASGGPAASKENFYGLHYETLPSYIVIGDDGIAMWKIELK